MYQRMPRMKSEGVVRLDVFVGMDGRAYDMIILRIPRIPLGSAGAAHVLEVGIHRLNRSYILTIDVSFSILEGQDQAGASLGARVRSGCCAEQFQLTKL